MKTLSLIVTLAVAGSAFAAPKVDLEKSAVKWEGKKRVLNTGHWGYVKIKSADVVFDKNSEPTAATVVIDMTKIEPQDIGEDKGASKLVKHLQSPDFFDTANHPEATFVAEKFTKQNNGKYKVDGALTIRGTTDKKASMLMGVEKEKSTIKVEGDLKFDRTKFGVSYANPDLVSVAKDAAIQKEVVLDIDLVLVN